MNLISNDTNKKFNYIIIGNSVAGLSAVESIRKIDEIGNILVLSYENYLNYSKPLITYYIANKVSLESVYFRPKEFYDSKSLFVKLDTKVTKIDTEKKCVITNSGDRFYFDKLLIASGGKPIIPKINVRTDNKRSSYLDSSNYKEIQGIFTLTTLDDAIKIKKYIFGNNINHASILGGGLIGLKTAEAFLDIGLQIDIIELSERILSATFDTEASTIIEDRIRKENSNIFTCNTVEEIVVSNNKIKSLRLRDGKEISTSLLVIAIGVIPNTEFLKNGDIRIERGIVVDEYMRTTSKDIYAAGDVVDSLDLILNKRRNIAIWPLAARQGAVAGTNMAGGEGKYEGGFFMNSVEILGIPSISMGMSTVETLDDILKIPGMSGKRPLEEVHNGATRTFGIPEEGEISLGIEVLRESRPEKNLYKKIVVSKNRIIGVILVGNIERAGIYAGLIKSRIDISSIKENLLREDFGIIQLPSEYRKHLVVGEGIEV